MNFNTAHAWAVEETAETVVDDLLDTPDVGRTYTVFYNAARMGRLQISVGDLTGFYFTNPGESWEEKKERFRQNRSARAVIELNYLRFVPYSDAHNFIATVERLLGRHQDEQADASAQAAGAKATAALTGYLWESVRVDDVVMTLDHSTRGPYDLLRHTTEHWKANGIDPFERWNGDRPWLEDR